MLIIPYQVPKSPLHSVLNDIFQDCASAEEFMRKLPLFDHELIKKRQIAEDAGEVSVLRCISTMSIDYFHFARAISHLNGTTMEDITVFLVFRNSKIVSF